MKKIFTLSCTILFTIFSIAQTKLGTVKGIVYDADKKQPLASSTITLLNRADSSSASYAISDKLGAFEMKNLPAGNFIVGVSTVGYAEYVKNITLADSSSIIDLGAIYLAIDTSSQLNVTVKAAAILVKKDTVEFKASAFPTKQNANVEDLLKKLPGVEVDKEGNITAQGQEITKVYVDGKEFFSNDPKLATKNLTAELIESIQVFDDMSDQSKFTQMDDGSRQRTINIKLKKDRRKGYFGRGNVAVGSRDRYSVNLSANTFNENRQLSFVGGANNINRLGFTFTDLVSNQGGMGGISGGNRGGGGGGGNRGGGGGFGGGGGRGGGGGTPQTSTPDGNTESWNAGVNFRDQWGKKFQIAGNYFASHSTTINRSNSNRQNFFPDDSTTIADNASFDRNSNMNHRFTMRAEYQIDSMNSLLITPNVSWQNSDSYSFDSSSTRTREKDSAEFRSVESRNDRRNVRSGYNVGNNLLYRHRFKKMGRTFTVGWTTGANNTEGESFVNSPNYFYDKTGAIYSQRLQNQRSVQSTNSFNNTISTSLTELIGKTAVLELNYAYTNNQSTSDRKTYDFSNVSKNFDSINKPLTNYFENGFISHRTGLNFRVKKLRYDYQIGGAVQMASLDNMSRRATTGKDSTMKQKYTNFFPTASFNYNFRDRKSMRFYYRGSTQAPSVTQLQDVVDQSNPLNFRIGNPNLKQEFSHNVQFSYNTFNVSNFLYLNVNANGSMTSNRIVNSTDRLSLNDIRRFGLPDSVLNQRILLSQPVNLNGNYNVSLSGTIGIPLKKVPSGRRSPMNLNLTSSIRYSQDASILYKVKNMSYTTSASERINFNYNIPDKLDITSSARLTYNSTKYSVQAQNNQKYINQTYSLEATYTIMKLWNLSSDFDYFKNNGLANGFNKGIPIWNLYVSRFLFKKKNGEIRFSVNDALNQNKSISRSSSDTYIQDTYTQVLSRFFLVSFSYQLNKFGGRSPQGEGGRERGNWRGGGGGIPNNGGNGVPGNGFNNGGNGM
jgi:uncharacterized membrane protein YgcG